MPQLDLMSFFTQFFWFSLSFIFFYISLLHFILPILVLNLKFRKKMLSFLVFTMNKKKEGVSNSLALYDSILQKVFSILRFYVSKAFNFRCLWISSNLRRINLDLFRSANILFLKTLSEINFPCIFVQFLLPV